MRGGPRRCRLAGGLAMVSPRGDMSAAKRTSASRARARLHGEERLARPLPRSGPRGRHPHPPTHPVAQGVLGRPQRDWPAGAGPLRHKCTGTRGRPLGEAHTCSVSGAPTSWSVPRPPPNPPPETAVRKALRSRKEHDLKMPPKPKEPEVDELADRGGEATSDEAAGSARSASAKAGRLSGLPAVGR